MADETGVRIENLAAFRSDLRRSLGSAPKLLTAGLRRGGAPVLVRTRARAPKRTGRMAAGYRISVSGSRGSLVSTVPYAGGADWGRRGKWKGFARYGAAPRIGGQAVEESMDDIEAAIYAELEDVVTAYGWFHS